MTAGTEVLVGGDTAFVKDFFDISDSYTPLIVLLVLGCRSCCSRSCSGRSSCRPKAIVMNLLSVGAAYGLIVLVFQKGGPAIGESIANLFGFEQVDAIEAWLPLFLFSILFGLSMDYHVFLLSRIREEYDKTGDNAEAVAYGLRTTGGIITGAAIIMVAVFAGFAAGRLTSLEQMGFGLAVAVFMDATIVRSILVPVDDAPARRPQLVPAGLAAVAAEGRRRGARRGRRQRAGAGHACRAGGGRGEGVGPLGGWIVDPRRGRASRPPPSSSSLSSRDGELAWRSWDESTTPFDPLWARWAPGRSRSTRARSAR